MRICTMPSQWYASPSSRWLRAQFTVLREALVHQAGQQVALLFQHLPALLQETRLPADLQQRALGGRDGQAFPLLGAPL
jgi:hypothetical protein